MSLRKHILTINNENYVLPVPPPTWNMSESQEISTTKVLGFGEVIDGNGTTLATTSVSRFFPNENMNFISDDEFRDKWDYVNALKMAKDEGLIIQYTITETPVNKMDCIITKFDYGEQDGSGDVFYTLELKENKSVELISTDSATAQAYGFVPKNHKENYYCVVQKNDTIYTIAKRAYGDTTKSQEILDKNNLKNPSQVKPGMTLLL